MCYGCWEELGFPNVVVPETRRAVEAVRRLYEVNHVGGAAHIVTDDWNLEDEHIEACFQRAGVWVGQDQDETDAAREVLELFRPMTEAQRATVLAIFDGFIPEPPEA